MTSTTRRGPVRAVDVIPGPRARWRERDTAALLAEARLLQPHPHVALPAGQKQSRRRRVDGPSFQYIDDSRLHDSMWRLARGGQDLDTTLSGEAELNEVDRQTRVLAILDDMATATAAVSAPGQSTNHKNIELHIDRLQLEIALARRSAETNDYTAAKALPQTCLACHTGTGGGPQR